MSKLFGGKNPFDDPFFTEPFGVWNDPCDGQQGARKQITIEELNPQGDGDGGQAQENSEPRKDLVVNNKKPSKKANGSHRFSYRRVAYGGLNGMYYTCSEGRMTGPDGVVLAEMKEDDKTIGESLHTISKGIHNKTSLATLNKTLKLMLISICLDGIKVSACWRIKGRLAACGMSLQIGGAWVVGNIQPWSTTAMQDRWSKSVNQGKILLGEPEEASQWSRGKASFDDEISGTTYILPV
ncbi:uncharacterized protein LOC129886684 isoform X2 [Solanum dulcamara]|uniref:uncharacterized protein LOC129886684 isoform X2 n=1 Tax=Solanum dulcamara TaxID=45834 RepID=UPI0024853E55|nr:uncharacterized protein LOC129886684 isoform X2 [Solanum dulcamara]